MAPLPVPDPSLQSTIYNALCKIYSFFKANPDLSPASITDPVKVATVQITGWEAPSLVPTTLTSSELPVATKNETWSEITNTQNPDGFQEFTSDRWNKTVKRSVDTEEPPMMAIGYAGIDAQSPELPEEEFDFSDSQEFWFYIFFYFVFVLIAAAAIYMTKIAKRANRRITRSLMELGGDHRM